MVNLNICMIFKLLDVVIVPFFGKFYGMNKFIIVHN